MRPDHLLPLVLLLAPLAAFGAEGAPAPAPAEPAPAWNLSIGTGGGGLFEFADGFAGASPPFDAHRESRLQLNARVDREVGRRFRAGLAYTYFAATWGYSSGGVALPGSLDDRGHVLLADLTFSWIRRERFEVYSALGVGVGWGRSSGTVAGTRYDARASGLSFQLRYVGLSVGGERVRFFADLGIGFEGLIVGGLLVRP